MSIYSTPLLMCDDEISNEETDFFTPEVSFSHITPRSKNRKKSHRTLFSIFNEQSFKTLPTISLLNTPMCRKKNGLEGSTNQRLNEDIESCTSTPFNTTPGSRRSTSFQCISNLITPVEIKPNVLKFHDLSKCDKENNSNNINNSCEINGILFKSDSTNLKSVSLQYEPTKSGLTFLQKFGIREKSEKKNEKCSKNSKKFEEINQLPWNEDPNTIHTRNYGTISDTKTPNFQNENIGICEKHFDNSSDCGVSLNSSMFLLQNKKFQNLREWKLWRFFGLCRKTTVAENMHLSPTMKLFPRYFQKLSLTSLKSLFSRNRKSINDVTETDCNQCPDSVVVTNEEIMLKLNSLETELKEIKSMMKSSPGIVITNVIPPPPIPPPPPPLPNLLLHQSIGALKRKVDVITPENEQIIKRPPRVNELRTHFSITVDDIKSVKLRKTPANCNSKRLSTNVNSAVTGVKDGVLHSVKFKATRKNAISKKDLSHIVSEILSPNKNITPGDDVANPNANGNKENSNIETTPIQFKNVNTKFRSTKRKDISSESPIRKRQNSGYRRNINHDFVSVSME